MAEIKYFGCWTAQKKFFEITLQNADMWRGGGGGLFFKRGKSHPSKPKSPIKTVLPFSFLKKKKTKKKKIKNKV
jgi:hypothetical protein